MSKHSLRSVRFSFIILTSAFCIFLILGAYQLHLPGLHYDEAKEAGLNAMQLVTGQPMTAFRDATVQFGPWRLPLMVQDYIGALTSSWRHRFWRSVGSTLWRCAGCRCSSPR